MNQPHEFCDSNNTALAKLDGAVRALAAASTLDEVLHIGDIAEAARVYAKAAKLGVEAQNKAAEIHVRAQRKAGELLASMDRQCAGRPKDNGSSVEPFPKLADMGISKQDSHRWQRLASLPDDAFEGHLRDTRDAGREITTAGLLSKERDLANAERNHGMQPLTINCTESLQELIATGTTFATIYADPPWKYQHTRTESRNVENHYPTMTLEEIKDLNIPVADDAVLFLWTTAPKLEESFEVVRSWDFNYRTCAIWDKETIGMGYWFRIQHELLLVATRGNFSPPDEDKRVSSVFRYKRSRHSAKPQEIRDLLAELYPDARKLELFARDESAGWESWGNE